MRKFLQWTAVALALVCLVGMLAGCGNDPGAATKAEADKIVDEMNAFITAESEWSNIKYSYRKSNIQNEFIYNEYVMKAPSEDATKQLEATLGVIFKEDTKELIGAKISCPANMETHSSVAPMVALWHISEFGFNQVEYEEYGKMFYKEGAELGEYTFSNTWDESEFQYLFVKSKYYKDLKFKN